MKWTKERLQKKVDEIFGEGELEVVKRVEGKPDFIRLSTEFGDVETKVSSVLLGNRPSIKSAIDRTAYFVKKAKGVHGEKYLYDRAVYRKASLKIEIGCRSHGYWWSTANSHLSKNGCPECGKKSGKKLSKEVFLKRIVEIHGDKYDYSKVVYRGYTEKIEVICHCHGRFSIRPSDHLQGQGCYRCGRELSAKKRTFSRDEFIKKARKIHGNKYCYDRSIYINSKKNIEIFCKKHGYFYMLPSEHMQGAGCCKCGKEKLAEKFSLSTEEFIQKARKVHGDRYLYDKVVYVNYKTKVEIGCKKHGYFKIIAGNHLWKSGCQKCNNLGFPRQKKDCRKGLIYIIKCWDDNEEFFKVGFTIHDVKRRYGKGGENSRIPYSFDVIEEIKSEDAEFIEKEFHKINIGDRHFPLKSFDGKLECYTNNPIKNLYKHIAKIQMEDVQWQAKNKKKD